MKRLIAALMSALVLAPAAWAADKEDTRLEEAGQVMKEILNIPDNIPQDLLDKAECIIVLPSVKKFAIGIGGSYGRGAMICSGGESFTGSWGAPAMFALEGGNIGIQLAGQATDFVLLIMNVRGAKSVMGSKVKLGVDAAAAAGPKGRTATAATDVVMRAEILSYSRSRGLFAGISLEGSTLRQDNGANKKLYGKEVSARDILLRGAVSAPAAAHRLISVLNEKTPKNLSDPKSLE